MYKFVRLSVTNEETISQQLNALAEEGWRVVAHSQDDNDYVFVMIKVGKWE